MCLELYFKSIINNFIFSIMSKTTEIQIEKSRNLIEGLRRHVREMGERGVSNNEINEMEKTVAMLSEANAEVDRLREELTPKVKKMNDLMTLVKASYAESKKTSSSLWEVVLCLTAAKLWQWEIPQYRLVWS